MDATPDCEARPAEAVKPLSAAQIARNKLAGTARQRGSDHPDVEVVRAELREVNAQAAVEKIVADWPPLSAETRAKLATILLAPGGEAHADAG